MMKVPLSTLTPKKVPNGIFLKLFCHFFALGAAI
jgi:hypothetical protein